MTPPIPLFPPTQRLVLVENGDLGATFPYDADVKISFSEATSGFGHVAHFELRIF